MSLFVGAVFLIALAIIAGCLLLDAAAKDRACRALKNDSGVPLAPATAMVNELGLLSSLF